MKQLVLRLGGAVITLLLSSLVIFASSYAAPTDPLTFLVGGPDNRTPERVAAIQAMYHLDDPFVVRYGRWLLQAVTGDFGDSLQYKRPVEDLVLSRIPVTLELGLYATALFLVFGVGLGIVSAVWRGRMADRVIVGSTTAVASLPSFGTSLALIAFFAVALRWFPAVGAGAEGVDRLWHLTLPAVALASGAVAVVSRVTRQSMIESFAGDHVEAARASGLTETNIVRRHVLRNSLGPIVTISALIIASLLSGTVVIENVFGISGLGRLLVDAINVNDFPVVQLVVLYMVFAYIIMTTLAEAAVVLLDPRLRRRSSS